MHDGSTVVHSCDRCGGALSADNNLLQSKYLAAAARYKPQRSYKSAERETHFAGEEQKHCADQLSKQFKVIVKNVIIVFSVGVRVEIIRKLSLLSDIIYRFCDEGLA